jgi:hypothetical protein
MFLFAAALTDSRRLSRSLALSARPAARVRRRPVGRLLG